MPNYNINTIFKFKRGSGEKLDVTIPADGEPCYDVAHNSLKIGDGVRSYGELPPLGFEATRAAYTVLPNGTISNLYRYNNDGLILALPSAVTQIQYDCFKNNKDIISVVQSPRTVTDIGSGAFENCTKLTTPFFSALITSIYADTYANCVSIYQFTLLKNITYIGLRAFKGCKNLKKVDLTKFSSTDTPPTLVNIDAFEDCSEDLTFYFGDQTTLENFANASNWCDLYDGNNFKLA